jgi:hypothetical protein
VLLDDERLNANKGSRRDETASILALESHHPAAAKMLLPPIGDSSETSMLQLENGFALTMRYEMKEIVLELLERRHSGKLISKSTFIRAAAWGDSCVIDILRNADMTPAGLREALCMSSLFDRFEAMAALLPRVNSAWDDGFGQSPVYYAALSGHAESVKLLLSAGYTFDSGRYCPKAAAERMRHTTIVALLEKAADSERQHGASGKRMRSFDDKVKASGKKRYRVAAVRS